MAIAKQKPLRLEGLDEVLRNLDKEVKGIRGRNRKGMQAAGLFIKGESMEHTPVSPDGGVLVNSAFFSTIEAPKGAILRIGYTAKYAPFVHEMPESNNFTKPDTGPKFLEKAVKNHMAKILEIIRNRTKI